MGPSHLLPRRLSNNYVGDFGGGSPTSPICLDVLPQNEGVPDTFVLRHWRAIVYFGLCSVVFTSLTVQNMPSFRFLVSIPLVWLAASLRQKVVLDSDGVELVNVFSRHRLRWVDIQGLEVVYTRLPWRFGWSIRLHYAGGHHDTFSLMDFGFRASGRTFATPPRDTPKPIRELHAIIVAALNQLRAG